MNHDLAFKPNDDLPALLGPEDRHLRALREAFGVRIAVRPDAIRISGQGTGVKDAAAVLDGMRHLLKTEGRLVLAQVQGLIAQVKDPERHAATPRSAPRSAAFLAPKSPGQARYLETIRAHDVTFCAGPAGTGKTFLAVAAAVESLRAGACRRIVLARPAVEAGERLGFLPGDLQEKVNPYLRPLIDSLGNLLDDQETQRLIRQGVVEIVPLAFMRGRTLERSFVILDEAQNCTVKQMLMFLTRLGNGSKSVITGDVTQTDLPSGETSGLKHAWDILQAIPGIGFSALDRSDVVRHPLVKEILEAYERHARGEL